MPGPGENQDQGCVVLVAYVPPAMIAIFFAVLGLLVLVFGAYVVTVARLQRQKKNLALEKVWEIEIVPLSVLEWVLLSARE